MNQTLKRYDDHLKTKYDEKCHVAFCQATFSNKKVCYTVSYTIFMYFVTPKQYINPR